MVYPSSILKYIIFFPNTIGAILGAGAVVSGFVLTLIFDHILVFEFPFMSFLRDLPDYLKCFGAIIFAITFVGSIGVILDGSVGKWLLIVYIVMLSTFVTLNIYVLVALHLSHSGGSVKDVSVPIIDVEQEALTYGIPDITLPPVVSETNKLITDNKEIDKDSDDSKASNHKNDENMPSAKPKNAFGIFGTLKNRVVNTASSFKDGVDNVAHGVKDKIGGAIHGVGDMKDGLMNTMHDLKDKVDTTAHNIKDGVGDKLHDMKENIHTVANKIPVVADSAHYISDTANNIKESIGDKVNYVKDGLEDTAENLANKVGDVAHVADNIRGKIVNTTKEAAEKIKGGMTYTANVINKGIKTAFGMVYTLQVTLTATASLIGDMFGELTTLEEKRVKWVQPILGRLTAPAYRLSAYPIAIKMGAAAIALEICFTILVGFYSTTKFVH